MRAARSVRLGFCASALVVLACGEARIGRPPITIAETDVPRWYEGLQFRIEDAGSGLDYVFWPHEGVAVRSFQLVTRANVRNMVKTEDAFSWTVERLDAPEVTIGVRMAPTSDGVDVTYELRNGSDEPRVVMVGPCFQLPDAFLDGVDGAARADHVFVPTAERGWRRISETHRTPGVADPSARLQPRPWTQHYASVRALGPEAVPHGGNVGLDLFGVAEEHVTAGVIVAVRPDGRSAIAVATDHEAGVTYALLDCLHAVIQAEVPAHGTTVVGYRVRFHEGSFSDLLARLRRSLPGLTLPPDTLG
ncbi:MAG TPA: hypothetical protein VMW35_08880 [Myxococcota bacterium]|nr:hypothetical protein [Myxococcota bacterium]